MFLYLKKDMQKMNFLVEKFDALIADIEALLNNCGDQFSKMERIALERVYKSTIEVYQSLKCYNSREQLGSKSFTVLKQKLVAYVQQFCPEWVVWDMSEMSVAFCQMFITSDLINVKYGDENTLVFPLIPQRGRKCCSFCI